MKTQRFFNSLLAILFLITFFLLGTTSYAQNLTRSNFISVLTQQYLGSGNTTRLPVVFRAQVQSLNPNATYRYYIQAGVYTDIGGTNSGAGNSMLISQSGSTYTYTTGVSLSSAGNYETFTTDASGKYTGWFCFVYTSNARFTAGNYIIPTITIDSINTGRTKYRMALNDSIKVLAFSTAAGANNGTGIYGTSNATGRNIIALFSDTSGTGRPLAITYVEDEGITVASTVTYYTSSVNGSSGKWGTIIPNNNPSGVRRIEQFSVSTGTSINYNTDIDGVWASGANTVNPTGSSTAPLSITVSDAPLPVNLSSFAYSVDENSVVLKWSTTSELNNKGFEVFRSADNINWVCLGFVKGSGNTADQRYYSFLDSKLSTGTYFYRLKQVDFNGNFENFNMGSAVKIGTADKFDVSQNYPNPFNPATGISYSLAEDAFVNLQIYDITGRLVEQLVNSGMQSGYHTISFDGSALASGVYFYKFTAAGTNAKYSKIMKMLLVK